MKKTLISLMTTLFLFFITSPVCLAAGPAEATQKFNFYMFRNGFAGCTSAQIAAFITFAIILLFLIFRKKIVNRLNNSTASSMLNAFIIFFSVFGIACFALAVMTDGETWSALMHNEAGGRAVVTQFSDYIITIQDAGSQRFTGSAARFTPFSLFIYFIIAQFLPPKLVLTESLLAYNTILKNQTFMFLYLILVMMCLLLIYRMNRSILRRNGRNMRDELVVFLTIVSYPSIYCIELGNIVGFSLALSLFFILFHDAKHNVLRELSHIALAASAAISPLTILFVCILVKGKTKKSIINIAKIVVYTLILFFTPCIFTGFEAISLYISNFFSINPEAYNVANMSIANLLIFFGIDNIAVLQIVSIIMNISALAAIVILPETWQKLSAVVYIILNVFAVSDPMMLIFVCIPFVFLLAEEKHKATDWLYLLVFALLITPFPEWFYFDRAQFNAFTISMGIRDIRNANNLISLAAVQFMYIVIICQSIKQLTSKKQKTGSEK